MAKKVTLWAHFPIAYLQMGNFVAWPTISQMSYTERSGAKLALAVLGIS